MNIREGMRRLALVAGVLGACGGAVVSYVQLQSLLRLQAEYKAVQKEIEAKAARSDQNKTGTEQGASHGPLTDYTPKLSSDDRVPNGRSPQGFVPITEAQEFVLAQKPATISGYLLLFVYPILGFLLPWTALRALSWILTGFSNPNRP